MKRRGPYVQIFFAAAAVQYPECQNIGGQPGNSNHHHRRSGYRLWMTKALKRLPDDKNGNNHQCNRIHERSKCGQSEPAKGVAGIGRATGKLHGQQSKQERGSVGQHMPGIGQQRQRSGDQSACHLNNHKGGSDAKSQQKPFGIFIASGVGMGVGVRHGIVPDLLLFLV